VAAATSGTRFTAGLLDISMSAGVMMMRVRREDHGPVFFGPPAGTPPQNRFDAPNGEYRTLYAAASHEGAFVETVLRKPKGRVLRRAFVDQRVCSIIIPNRDLRLAKLYDEGLQFHQIDASLISIDDYTASRSLALAFYQEFPNLDGIAYRSRYDNGELCFALFDRIPSSMLRPIASERFDANPLRVDYLMRMYGAVFDTSSSV
jgi:hypothetical protein